MKEFSVYFVNPASTVVKVEAEDADDAIDKAYDEAKPYICHQCSCQPLELGDAWEPITVFDEETNEVVWSE